MNSLVSRYDCQDVGGYEVDCSNWQSGTDNDSSITIIIIHFNFGIIDLVG